MLEYLGWGKAAEMIRKAVAQAIAMQKATPDLVPAAQHFPPVSMVSFWLNSSILNQKPSWQKLLLIKRTVSKTPSSKLKAEHLELIKADYSF